MKKIITSLIILFLLLSSCIVPKSDNDKLKLDNENLKLENEKLQLSNNQLDTLTQQLSKKLELIDIENERIKQKKLEISLHTENEALRSLEDYYKFYYANKVYRNPQLRRIDDNKFKVSLEECINKEGFKEVDNFWDSRVLTIEINNNGTYKVY